MKLLNLNVGINIDNSKKIADYISKIDADFVSIQEIGQIGRLKIMVDQW